MSVLSCWLWQPIGRRKSANSIYRSRIVLSNRLNIIILKSFVLKKKIHDVIHVFFSSIFLEVARPCSRVSHAEGNSSAHYIVCTSRSHHPDHGREFADHDSLVCSNVKTTIKLLGMMTRRWHLCGKRSRRRIVWSTYSLAQRNVGSYMMHWTYVGTW